MREVAARLDEMDDAALLPVSEVAAAMHGAEEQVAGYGGEWKPRHSPRGLWRFWWGGGGCWCVW